jgi:hypothetical protein
MMFMALPRLLLKWTIFVCVIGAILAFAHPMRRIAADDRTSANPGVVEISQSTAYSRVIAVSDVHGMHRSLVDLLKGAKLIDENLRWIGGNALFIVIGDSIDKGPEAVEVVAFWLALAPQVEAAGGHFVHLLGNHEAEFLADPQNHKDVEFTQELISLGIPVAHYTSPEFAEGRFLCSSPLALRIGRWLFLHAGLYPEMSWPAFISKTVNVLRFCGSNDPFLVGNNSPLEAKDWWLDKATRQALEDRLEKNGMFGVVFGHMPKALNAEGRITAADGGRLIKIDNGMASESGSHPGHLLVFPQPAQLWTDSGPEMLSVGTDGVEARIVSE